MCAYSFSTSNTNLLQIHFKIFGLTEQIKKTFFFGLGNSLGGGNGNPFKYSCLGNPMDGGAWWATVHHVEKSQIRLSD